MATYTWIGTLGTIGSSAPDWFSADVWTPVGTPASGDNAIVAVGTAALSATNPAIAGVQITLGSGSYSDPAAIDVTGGTIAADTTIAAISERPYADLRLTGGATLNGAVDVAGGQLSLTIDDTLTGSGTIEVEKGGTADITMAGTGTAIARAAFLDENGTFILENPAAFGGQISGLRAGDRIELGHKVIVESTTYENGVLTLYGQNHAFIATLAVSLQGDPVTFYAQPYGHGASVLTTSQQTRVWGGGDAGWFDPIAWNSGVPLGGDTARILAGRATVSAADAATNGTMDSETVQLGAAGSSAPATFAATDVYFGPGFTLMALGTPQYTPSYIAPQATFVATGYTRFQGNLEAMSHGGTLAVDIESNGSVADFVLAGTPGPADADTFAEALASQESTLLFTGTGTLTNNGLVLVDGAAQIGAGVEVQGAGTIEMEAGGSVGMDGTVAATQSIMFGDETGTLILDNLASFAGTVDLFPQRGDRIDMSGLNVGSADYDPFTRKLSLLNQDGGTLGSFNVVSSLALDSASFAISDDGNGGSLLTYTPQQAQLLRESLPVAAVGTTGATVSLSTLLTEAFGAMPSASAYSEYILSGPQPKMATESYWEQGPGQPTNSVWLFDGTPITQAVTVSAANIGDYSLSIGNSIVRTAWFDVPNAENAGAISQYVQYNIWTVDPSVDTAAPPASTAVTPNDIVDSAVRYNAVYNGVLNYNNCNWIADNLTAGAGAVMPFVDTATDPTLNQEGGFWRIVYRGSDQPSPVADWYPLTKPGDVVRMGRIDGGGQHTTTVIGVVNPDRTITVYDNGDANAKGQNIIGIHEPTYWTGTEPASITIYRLDPNQRYLITGSSLTEYLQGSVYNDLIRPSGGTDTIVGGPGNNEVQGTTAHLDGIAFTDFKTGDRLDFTDLSPTGMTPGYDGASGMLTITAGGSVVATVALPTALPYVLVALPDGSGGTTVELACFAEGTRIATAGGLVAVERLAEGMPVRTASGGTAPVVWLGHRRVDCARHPNPAAILPVRIAAHAFGRGMPSRDLLLSPDHAIFAEDVLIPVKHLIDGDRIAQLPSSQAPAVTYWHVELPRHDVLLAEGLPAESYLDDGGRANFANGGGPTIAHPDFSMRQWEAYGYAPLCVTGPAVEAVRRRLRRRAAGRKNRAA